MENAINVFDIIDYERNQNELERYILFAICVAGKTAIVQEKALRDFLMLSEEYSPFEAIRGMIKQGTFEIYLKESKLGQYTKLSKAFRQLVNSNINLETCTVEDLEAIHGVGPKTARFFLTYTRPDQQYAVLDTHILRFMREKLYIDTPKSTPTGNKYKQLENKFLEYAKTTGKSIPVLDLEIWTAYSTKQNDLLTV